MKTWSVARCGLALLLASTATAQVTQRVSVGPGGNQGNSDSFSGPFSADARFIAFSSAASNLVARDTNWVVDIFVCERRTGAIERVSVDSNGVQGDGECFEPSISADGRYVAFRSAAANLVVADTNKYWDVFVRDREAGTTERVSVDSNGAEGHGYSFNPSISADGRFVAFASWASDLVGGDTNALPDVFVRDRRTGMTTRVSVSSTGAQPDGWTGNPSISADGRYVAFESQATTLVGGDTNGDADVFLHDRRSGTTERVSVASNGSQGNEYSVSPSISADGRCVAFWSGADNLVPRDSNGCDDIFVRDRQTGVTERLSVDSAGGEGNGQSYDSAISADGRTVVFTSQASNLVGADGNSVLDVFVHDRLTGATERASLSSAGAQGSHPSVRTAISADGRFVSFDSLSPNLAGGDTNGFEDVFVRDRDYAPAKILCFPGAEGVVDCPCFNLQMVPDRGCDNSELTGGAALWASGVAYLSADTLVFTTGSEVPTATSLLLQGDAYLSSGVVYGQGVRCVGGALERLYTKSASVGSVTMPDFAAGDPSVSARSAARGASIQPGQSRWYLVYYRDPIGADGCPAASKFNATPTAEVSWLP